MKLSRIILILILLLTFLVRLYRIDSPLLDWHSWRQADTAAVARNFLKSGFDLLHPRFDDLSNIPSGQENPQGYRFVEFPLYNTLHAAAFKFLPFWNFEVWGRLVSILASLISAAFLYLIVKEHLGERVGFLSSFFFAVLPFNIYYSRVILPEPMMVAASLGTIYFFKRFWLLSALLASLALLLKPFAVFLIFPALFYLTLQKRLTRKSIVSLFLCFFVSLFPFIAWRWWMGHFPEGIPANEWLFNAANIRFKGAFFYWLFAERIGKLILGYWGLIPFALGLILKPEKEGWFFHFWLLGIGAFFSIIAAGNVQHDYYQVLAVPVICVFLAKGTDFFLSAPKADFNKVTCYLLLVTCLLFMLAFSWYHVRGFFNINNPVLVKAGEAVARLTPQDAKVIAPYGGDTAFLYQTNRRGWPVGIEIEKMIKNGAQYYVNVNFDGETEWVMVHYQAIEKTDDYVIVKLQ